MPKIGIVAAMEREVSPLIRGWKVRTLYRSGHVPRRYRIFEAVIEGNSGSVEISLICGGVGYEAARRATEFLILEVNPELVISVGFAGALDASLRVGDVVVPKAVINSADGSRTDMESGDGILVSSPAVAGKEQKARFAKAYGAFAVDMEAAAVAHGASARAIEFAAIKVISDAADFEMPALDRFVTSDGRFQTLRFACHAVLRPWLWGRTVELARNSSRASRALGGAITDYLRRKTKSLKASRSCSAISGANSAVDSLDSISEQEFAGAHTTVGTQAHTLSKPNK
jgi:adenosylhomocysteine nucleosidase